MLNKTNMACPSLKDYQQLASGSLPEIEKESLLSHLENCEACAQTINTLPESDTLVGLLRQTDTVEDLKTNGVIGPLVERLSKLRPENVGKLAKPATGVAQSENTIDLPAEVANKTTFDFLASPQSPDELGRLGPYRVLEVLGTGGMGVVFRAEDPQLARIIALKAMLPGSMTSESARQRFLREARAVAAIKHDHIVSIYQVGEDRGVLFLAMELLEGEPLDERLQREGKLPVPEVLGIGRQIALGLAAAHKRGLVHRDIKPANIYLESESNRVKLLDFGLARTTGEQGQLTQQGAIVGTPAYMAPEQAKGKDVDHRCDLFSLGCVLYRMATGEPAFRGTDVVSTLVSVATETPRPPQVLEPSLPKALSELIVNLLAKDAANRPASAQAVVEMFDRIPQAEVRPATPKGPRRRWPALAAAAASLALLAAAMVYFLQTPDGVVRIEIDDHEIKLAIEGHSATFTNADKQPITLKPGKHGMTITRGDFVFNTASFELAKKGKTALKITWHPGEKIVVMQDGMVIGEKPVPPVPPAASGPLPPRYKNSLGMEFVLVPKGDFLMGGGAGTVGANEVSIANDFYLGKYEVTQGEWEAVTGVNPSFFRREGGGRNEVVNVSNEDLKQFPVENVSWDDAQLFVQALNKREKEAGWLYRLPNEAEWEYACRGGPTSNKFDYAFDFYFDKPAKELLPDQANFLKEKGLKRTCKVGLYQPNRLGLYDMHGNVHEWCNDGFDPKDPQTAVRRVSAGGSWGHESSGRCRAASREVNGPLFRNQFLGLRLARVRIDRPRPPSFAAASFDEKKAKTHQDEWATYLGRKVVEENSIGMKLTLIPPGKFLMGSADLDKDVGIDFKGGTEEGPKHAVEISRPFVVSSTEITQEHFEKIVGRNPSGFSAKGLKAKEVTGLDARKLPVEMVTWYDAIEFCNKLSEKEGIKPYYELAFPARAKDGVITAADVKELGGTGYRLPTEAEWEYACRAGTVTPFSFPFNFGTFPQYGWFGYDSGRPHDVGDRKPNAFGLSDMHGNVFEWCGDWFGAYASGTVQDPRGPAMGTYRIARGGAYNHLVEYGRSASRGRQAPGSRYDNTGFRVVHSVQSPVAPAVAADRRVVPPSPVDDAWLKKVAALPTKEQVEAVTAKLKELNPGFEGVRPEIEGRVVTALHFGGAGLTDISPLRALPGLRKINLQSSGTLADLSPLKDMKLTWLFITGNPVSDLSPLKDMKLTYIKFHDTGVKDLSPLKDMKPTFLVCWGSPMTDDGLKPIQEMISLRQLELVNLPNLTDKGLECLKKLADLEILQLGNTKLTGAGLVNLKGMTKLESLAVSQTRVSDESLVYLKDLLSLRELALDRTRVTDAGLEHLAGLKNLVWLTLNDTAVTDKGLVHLKGLLGLRKLSLQQTGVTDAGLEQLAGMKLLTELNLQGTGVTAKGVTKLKAALPKCNITADVKEPVSPVDDAWLKEVAALPPADQVNAVAGKLKDLNPGFDGKVAKHEIEGRVVTSLTIAGGNKNVTDIAPLRALPGLREVHFYDFPLSDLSPLKDLKLTVFFCLRVRVADLSPLKDMKLTVVHLVDTPVKDLSPLKGMPVTHFTCVDTQVSDLTSLQGMPIQHLNCSRTQVSNLTPLKGMPLHYLNCAATQVSDLTPLQDMSGLHTLEIAGPKITDATFATLKKLTDLQTLNAPGTKVTDAGLLHLKAMVGLRLLRLAETEVTDAGLVHLEGLFRLRTLDLAGTRVTDGGLEHLAGLKNLEVLDLKGTAVTAKGVAKLKAVLPKCNIIADMKASIPPSAALEALGRDKIPLEALKLAGDGDPKKAPASLVGVLGEAEPVHGADQVSALALSGDGRWLASATRSGDFTILLRDVATGRVERGLKGHTGGVMVLAFSKDSRTLVSASVDGTLKLWPMDKSAEPQTVQPKLGEIASMAVSADGRFVAASGTDRRVLFWKWGQWDTPMEITPEGQTGTRLALSADGELLAVAQMQDKSDTPIRIYKTSDGKLKQSLTAVAEKGRLPSGDVSFSRDGKYLACFLTGYKSAIWDVASGKPVADFTSGQFGSHAFSPDGKTLAVANRWFVGLYDVPSMKQQRILSAGHLHCFPVAFSPDGKLLAGGFSTGTVHVWDTTSWKEKYLERGHRHFVRGVAISPDGSSLLSVGDDDTLRRWNLVQPATNQILHQFLADDYYAGPTPQGCASVAYSPDGKSFALVVRGDGYTAGPPDMSVWDATTNKKRWSLPVSPNSIAFSLDGKTLAGQCMDGGVRLWEVQQGREIQNVGTMGPSSGLAFSKDGKLLAAASQDKEGLIKVWNVASGAEIHSWKDSSMTAVAFPPDGQILAVGHKDGTISVWDLAEGKKKRTLKGHSAQVQSLKFTPAGKTLISSGHDGTIRVWNPEVERATQVIALGCANQRLAIDLDSSGTYVFAAGHAPVIFVLRLAVPDGAKLP